MIVAKAKSVDALRILAVTNMYANDSAPTSGIFVEQQVRSLRKAGLSVEVLFLDRAAEGPDVYRRLRFRLQPRVASFDPHLVHVMYGGVMAERVTRFVEDRPVVVTYHGSDLQGAPGATPIRRVMARFGVWASARAARRASGIVTVSGHLQEHLPRAVDRSRVATISCGVDLRLFQPMHASECRARLGWNESEFHVLFVTNNRDPIKRPELARASVDVLVREGVPARLQLLHGVRYEDVPLWLNAADVLLVTSRREGSPTVVKEALACDRPIVSVAVGDIEGQIEGVEGCYIAEASPEALADGLRRVRSGPRHVRGRERVAEHALERTADRLRDFYERTVARWELERAPARVDHDVAPRAATSAN